MLHNKKPKGRMPERVKRKSTYSSSSTNALSGSSLKLYAFSEHKKTEEVLKELEPKIHAIEEFKVKQGIVATKQSSVDIEEVFAFSPSKFMMFDMDLESKHPNAGEVIILKSQGTARLKSNDFTANQDKLKSLMKELGDAYISLDDTISEHTITSIVDINGDTITDNVFKELMSKLTEMKELVEGIKCKSPEKQQPSCFSKTLQHLRQRQEDNLKQHELVLDQRSKRIVPEDVLSQKSNKAPSSPVLVDLEEEISNSELTKNLRREMNKLKNLMESLHTMSEEAESIRDQIMKHREVRPKRKTSSRSSQQEHGQIKDTDEEEDYDELSEPGEEYFYNQDQESIAILKKVAELMK